MRPFIVLLAALPLMSCTHLDEFNADTERQLRPMVWILYKQCVSAVASGQYDRQALLDEGLILKEDREDGTTFYDNDLPEKGKLGVLSGTGLTFKFKPEKSKCSFSVGPDGYSNTVMKLMGQVTALDKEINQLRRGKEMYVDTDRSGSQMSYFTTTITLRPKN